MTHCISTRGNSPSVLPGQALLQGAARDGGLFLMDRLVDLSPLMALHHDITKLAAKVFQLFLPDLDSELVTKAAQQAYAQFEHPDAAPLKQVGEDFILELFHGPTAAFKDLALQALPLLMAIARLQYAPDTGYTVLAATSGDTGSAAMSGFARASGFHALVYYPQGGVSPVQLQQMLSLCGEQARAIGIRGNFDDAQAGVKAAFSALRHELPRGQAFSSANSINIGRLLAQMVYYIKACGDLRAKGALKDGQAVDFVVPSGNFGNILAGYLVKKMGLPVGQLVCVSNANTVLADFLNTGVYDRRRVLSKTQSPSMDILVSSNLERLLYYAAEEDAQKVAAFMDELNNKGVYAIDEAMRGHINAHFVGVSRDDAQGRAAIRTVYERHRYLLDPHTALAYAALKQLPSTGNPKVVVATASPFKFPRTLAQALGREDLLADNDPLRALSRATGHPIPRALQGLMGQAFGAETIIDAQDLVRDVQRRVAAW